MDMIPQGYKFATIGAGFRKSGRPDLALVVSDSPAAAAGVFTQALFKAAPVLVGQDILSRKETTRAVVMNSGQANACTGEQGMANCRRTLELISRESGLAAEEILPASTGVIGNQLAMEKWEAAVPGLVNKLGTQGPEDFAKAIMTTDSFHKMASAKVKLSDGTVRLVGMAKGAGMICPNMATMLSVVLCDAAITVADWRAMFRRAVDATFNRVTVDGDTSTNDTLYGLANGASGVTVAGEELEELEKALVQVLAELAYKLVQDGEGATKVIHIKVTGAADDAAAEQVARTVGHSQLVKTAMYGKDANWGRIIAAVGRAGIPLDPMQVRLSLFGVELFANGGPTSIDFDALLKEPLEGRDVLMDISLGDGPGEYTLLASDLTHEYVSINADYRS